MADAMKTGSEQMQLRQSVLASNKQTMYGMLEQRELHHGRISWEKKYLCIVIKAGRTWKKNEGEDIPL